MNAFLIIFSDAILVCLGDTFVSVLAGFSVFAMLGVLSHELGTDIESVIQSGQCNQNSLFLKSSQAYQSCVYISSRDPKGSTVQNFSNFHQ